jgi:hypothetical protein
MPVDRLHHAEPREDYRAVIFRGLGDATRGKSAMWFTPKPHIRTPHSRGHFLVAMFPQRPAQSDGLGDSMMSKMKLRSKAKANAKLRPIATSKPKLPIVGP